MKDDLLTPEEHDQDATESDVKPTHLTLTQAAWVAPVILVASCTPARAVG